FRPEHAAKPAPIFGVARHHARPRRASLSFAEECRRAGGDAFDRTRTALNLLDVDAGMQIFGHDPPPSRSFVMIDARAFESSALELLQIDAEDLIRASEH